MKLNDNNIKTLYFSQITDHIVATFRKKIIFCNGDLAKYGIFAISEISVHK